LAWRTKVLDMEQILSIILARIYPEPSKPS